MQSILHLIHDHRCRHARLPFYEFLRDESLSAAARLSFLPCMAPAVGAWDDLNRYVLRVEPTEDPLQIMINDRADEAADRWTHYLGDFVKLGHDFAPEAPSETLRELWSESSARSRMLSYHLAHLILGAQTAVRLAVLEAMDQARDVLFGEAASLAESVRIESGVRLLFCGVRGDAGPRHPMWAASHEALARIELTTQQRDDAHRRVDDTFDLFDAWTGELLRYARAQLQADAALDDGVLMNRRESLRLMAAG